MDNLSVVEARSQALVTAGHKHELLSLLPAGDIQSSIQENDQNQTPEIWEKLPHGGPYVKSQKKETKSNLSSALGSLSRPEDQWGYEKVHVGPTTNIVGDAMSSKALDLIRIELKERSESESLLPRPESSRAPDPVNSRNSLLLKTRELMRSLASRISP